MLFFRIAAVWIFSCIAFLSAAHAVDQASEEKAKQIWQMLDYLAVDYGGAVDDGKIVNADEYVEMEEFSRSAEQQIGALPQTAAQAELLQQARSLRKMIADKAAAGKVAQQAQTLANALLAAYPIPVTPARTPDLQQGARLYQSHCASCHGAEGKADGPLAAGMNPPPIAFTDRVRARERSVLSLYQTTSRGVEGTAMPSFATLPDQDRWALAFYVSTLAYQNAERRQGEALWSSDRSLQAAIKDLAALTQWTEAALARDIGAEKAGAALAYLRSHPEAVAASTADGLALAKSRLRESLTTLERGDRAGASRLAISAYLDGFEPVEPALAAKNKELFHEIEQAMGAYRSAVSEGRVEEARSQESRLQSLIGDADATLKADGGSPWATFLAALTILLREGVEALLIVVAMIAFLKKADRSDVLPYVHAGWASALGAGVLTWVAATYLVELSGASREITEGFAAIFAAVVLLTVGIWMHQKSLAGRWQAYVRDKLTTALNKRSAMVLFVLAFVTVYREVFETVLFYAALWTEDNGRYLLAGLAAGIVILAVITVIMLRTSARLPISRFFAISSALIAVLAVVLVGKGVAALQEAGMLDVTPLALPRVDLLGIYPTWQTLAAQCLVLLVVLASFGFNLYSQAKVKA
ncbi:MAG TPA: iron permease [Oxalobacteraceae bacterium]|nr:iron permease [Oxalobacteraceae bacterium]